MASLRNNSTSSVTGFDFGFSDQSSISKQGSDVEKIVSMRDERPYAPTLRRRPSKALSNPSYYSTRVYNPRPYFRSRRIIKGTIDRPELREKDPRAIWMTLIPSMGFVLGFAIIALLSWSGYSSVSRHQYCHVFTDDFTNGFNSTIWTKHVETGGYG